MIYITRNTVSAALVGFLLGVCVLGGYGHTRVRSLENAFTSLRTEIEQSFLALADKADRIEVISESAVLVRDCDARARFEQLLSAQPTLTQKERAELDILFAACGDYHARLKAFYAERLVALASRYADQRALHSAVFASPIETERIQETMKTIAAGENARASDLFELVALQRAMNDVYAGRSTQTLPDITTLAAAIEKRFAENDRALDQARGDLSQLTQD